MELRNPAPGDNPAFEDDTVDEVRQDAVKKSQAFGPDDAPGHVILGQALVDQRIGETNGQPYGWRRHPEFVKAAQENFANAVRLGQRRAVHRLSVLEPGPGFLPDRATLDLQDEDAVSRRGDQEVGLGEVMPFSAELE
jgi:hypothetical protein